ncbi:MAG TPA: DUF429 domain-containing protein, partial [Sulfurovum sp.]|nr:DUF429 domain-containing protein [Sulfurovum sp.]
RVIQTVYLQSDEAILDYIYAIKPDKIAVDAALEVKNESGTRAVERALLKDFAQYKLGIYPINKKIMDRLYGGNRAEELFARLHAYTLRENLFEVYTHATIIRCFTQNSVLPYKRKKGRTTAFIKEQLTLLQNFLLDATCGLEPYDISISNTRELKIIEDKLDSIVCAYSLHRAACVGFDSYDGLLVVPKASNHLTTDLETV